MLHGHTPRNLRQTDLRLTSIHIHHSQILQIYPTPFVPAFQPRPTSEQQSFTIHLNEAISTLLPHTTQKTLIRINHLRLLRILRILRILQPQLHLPLPQSRIAPSEITPQQQRFLLPRDLILHGLILTRIPRLLLTRNLRLPSRLHFTNRHIPLHEIRPLMLSERETAYRCITPSVILLDHRFQISNRTVPLRRSLHICPLIKLTIQLDIPPQSLPVLLPPLTLLLHKDVDLLRLHDILLHNQVGSVVVMHRIVEIALIVMDELNLMLTLGFLMQGPVAPLALLNGTQVGVVHRGVSAVVMLLPTVLQGHLRTRSALAVADDRRLAPQHRSLHNLLDRNLALVEPRRRGDLLDIANGIAAATEEEKRFRLLARQEFGSETGRTEVGVGTQRDHRRAYCSIYSDYKSEHKLRFPQTQIESSTTIIKPLPYFGSLKFRATIIPISLLPTFLTNTGQFWQEDLLGHSLYLDEDVLQDDLRFVTLEIVLLRFVVVGSQNVNFGVLARPLQRVGMFDVHLAQIIETHLTLLLLFKRLPLPLPLPRIVIVLRLLLHPL